MCIAVVWFHEAFISVTNNIHSIRYSVHLLDIKPL